MIKFPLLLFTLVIRLILQSSLCNAICYYPDGQVAQQDVPCLGGSGVSACCGAFYACLSNGLCMHANAIHDGSNLTYLRGSCTDQQWRAAACPAFCLDPGLGTLREDQSSFSRRGCVE